MGHNILKHADDIVNRRSEEKDRQYGPFKECMTRAFNVYNLISPRDQQLSSPEAIYRVLIALKLAREAHAHKEDNLLDAVAYMGALNNYIENI